MKSTEQDFNVGDLVVYVGSARHSAKGENYYGIYLGTYTDILDDDQWGSGGFSQAKNNYNAKLCSVFWFKHYIHGYPACVVQDGISIRCLRVINKI